MRITKLVRINDIIKLNDEIFIRVYAKHVIRIYAKYVIIKLNNVIKLIILIIYGLYNLAWVA